MRKTEVICGYNFEEDAMGLGDFITQQMAKQPDDEIVVLVFDGDGNPAKRACFERELLTDGSTVTNLVIRFDTE